MDKLTKLTVALTCLLSACATSSTLQTHAVEAARAQTVTVSENLAYTDSETTEWSQTLRGDLYQPIGLPGPRPVVLVVHGGGWASRSRADTAAIARDFAERGYVAFNISHRFAPEHVYPAQLRDLQQAVRWLREHADEYGIDPDRIAGYGYSSGAHLVALLAALSPGDAQFQAGTRLQAAVLGGTPADLREYDSGTLVPRFLGTSHADGYETYVEASPVVHVSADDPPMFFYHGAQDFLVVPKYARAMHQALREAGVPTQLRIEQFKGHAAMFLLGGRAESAGMDFLDQVLRGQ